MFNPCIDYCFIENGKRYTKECDTTCGYAKTARELDKYKELFEELKTKLNSFDFNDKDVQSNQIDIPVICKANVNISNTTGRKCPHCGESYYTELYSDSTTVYYPPIYKNGVNINPDRNQTTTTCRCLNCGKEFTY